jgi:hypothetical protein
VAQNARLIRFGPGDRDNFEGNAGRVTWKPNCFLCRMIRALSLLLLASLGALAQQTSEASFVGAWEAKIKDTVFLVLKITNDGKLAGTMSEVDISADADGNITDAEPAGKESPIRDVRLEDGKLTFREPKENKGQDADDWRWEVKITGEGAAELRPINAPPDVKMKPIPLRRR